MKEKDATLGQGIKMLTLIEQKETPCEQLQKLLASGLLADLLDANVDEINRNAFRQFIGLKPLDIYTLTINYSRSVEDGVKAGKYDWSNSDITSSHFSSDEVGTKEVSIELIHFGRNMETNEVLSELDKMELRPATLKELLAFGEKYPNLQRKFPIIALGSVWQYPDGNRRCAHLGGRDSERNLNLRWLVRRWNDHCRFAAVRK